MSLTLGEKLRQAREERGITLGEVAEQTRISPMYIESIENDDYRSLPGGIFNKGFVKSFAKYVGVDEQEALQDYMSLNANQVIQPVEDARTYRPEVLTDDRTSSSSLPTIIVAVLILGLMTAGILFLVNYIRNKPAETASVVKETNANTAANVAPAATPTLNAPTMSEAKVEFKALKEPVSITSTVDGKKSYNMISPDKSGVFEPKQNLILIYSKDQSPNVQMTINGKPITLPPAPATPGRSVIELNISTDNFKQIWDSGAISFNTAAPAPR